MFIKFQEKYGEYFEHLQKRGMTEKTISEHKRMLCDHFPERIRTMRLAKMTKSDIADLLEAGREHGAHGPTRLIVVLRRYFNFMQSELNMEMPFDWRDVKVPMARHKEQPVFEDHEIALLFKTMEDLEPGSVHGKRMNWTMSALFETLFATGMRIHEPLMLKRSQFPQIKASKELVILGKGSKERKIFFSDRAIEKLEEYLGRRNDTNDALFVNSCGEPLIMATARSYFERFKRKLRELGHEEIARKLKSHTFRRTLSTHLFENGADIKTVQKILGHESERTTIKCYIRANEKRAKVIHTAILSKIPFEKLATRYKEVPDGSVHVRITENGGRWMPMDEQASEELKGMVSMMRDQFSSPDEKRTLQKLFSSLGQILEPVTPANLELENVGG